MTTTQVVHVVFFFLTEIGPLNNESLKSSYLSGGMASHTYIATNVRLAVLVLSVRMFLECQEAEKKRKEDPAISI